MIKQLTVSFNFVSARGLQFLSPIVAANFLPISTYGDVEFNYAFATLVAAVIGFGFSNLIPLSLIRSESQYPIRSLLSYPFYISILLLIFAFIQLAFNQLFFAFSVLLVLILLSLSTYVNLLRSRGEASISMYLESTPFFTISVAAVVCNMLGRNATLLEINCALLFLGIYILLKLFKSILNEPVPQCANYLCCFKSGIPLMYAGMLGALVSSSGRIAAGFYGDDVLVGDFSAISRVTILPIILHQFIMVVAFRELYQLSNDRLANILVLIAILVGSFSIAMILYYPYISSWAGEAFYKSSSSNQIATRLMLSQVLLWSGISINDLLATRNLVTKNVLPWSNGSILISAGVSVIILNNVVVDVNYIAAAQLFIVGLCFIAQSIYLFSNGVKQIKYWITTITFSGSMLFTSLLI